MLDYVESMTAESDRFLGAIRSIEAAPGSPPLASAPVASCPGWSAADLTWHLAEVQYFWASVVEAGGEDISGIERLDRPPDDGLIPLMGEQSARLTELLSGRDPDQPCWSWYADGHSIGWVQRRQAHEALVHRVDAELAAGTVTGAGVTAIDEELASDGVDEMLWVMLGVGGLPTGLRYETDGTSIALEVPGRSWAMTIGRMTGTDPRGEPRDEPAVQLLRSGEPTSATVSGPASELDLWLWRRLPLTEARVDGDTAVAERLHDLATID